MLDRMNSVPSSVLIIGNSNKFMYKEHTEGVMLHTKLLLLRTDRTRGNMGVQES